MRRVARNESPRTSFAESIFEKCAPKIYVDVQPDVFSFHSKTKVLELKTCVHISSNGPPYKVLAVGESVGFPNAEKIALFSDQDRRPKDVDMHDLLHAFLLFAIKNVVSKGVMFRPVLIFRNVLALERYLHGYEKAVLSDIALFAGAMRVYFE